MFYSISSYLFYAQEPLLDAMENAGADLASFEGKYPKDLFNKTVVAGGQPIGRVAKETDDLIVVFSDSDLRFDVPKSKIVLAGGSVIVNESLDQCSVDKDAPPELPEDIHESRTFTERSTTAKRRRTGKAKRT